MVLICKQEDDFLEDKTVWFVDLNNGERIWMDDDRPGCEPTSAWKRLAQYINIHELNIVNLSLKFRSHIESPLPKNAPGYFFVKRALASPGMSVTIVSYIIGFWDGEMIQTQEWSIPALIQENVSSRLISSLQEPQCLIISREYNELFKEHQMLSERPNRE